MIKESKESPPVMRRLVGRSSEDSQDRQFPGVDNVAAKMLKIESESTLPEDLGRELT